ncbi:MAG TPA: DUF6484 domain-containing protein [Telluria sp.]|jgi:hypothetical protein
MLQKENLPQFGEQTQAAPEQPDRPQQTLLENVIAQSALPPQRADGIAIGVLDSFDSAGKAQVSIAAFGLSSLSAHTLVPLTVDHLGAQLALGFESGDPQRPIIIGLLLSAQPQNTVRATAPDTALKEAQDEDETNDDLMPLDVIVDGRHVMLEAEREIELRCGEAAIIMTADGHIQIRGTYITSHASATQRILGGSVNVN